MAELSLPDRSLPAAADLGAGRSRFIGAQDGMRLHVREYGVRTAPVLPVVCLPGLTRTVADFDALAPFLSSDRYAHRYVIAIDSRGRGQSDYDPHPANYNVATELSDVLAVLTALEISRTVVVGSSRGGILAMLMGIARPTVVAGAVLHDIGPIIEAKGLMRIKSYVGKLPQPRTFAEGADILQRLFGAQFPKVNAEQWLAAAQRAWKANNTTLIPTYDVRIAQTLTAIDAERPPPPLWNEFDTLSHVPLLVIRGANSDILSAPTVVAMAARHPHLQAIEVADEGHVPLLEGELVRRIGEFVATCDHAATASTVNSPNAGAIAAATDESRSDTAECGH